MGNEIGCMGSKKFQEPGLEELKNGLGITGNPSDSKVSIFSEYEKFLAA